MRLAVERVTLLLRLGRVSNLPTVWTNTLTGVVLSGGALRSIEVPALIVLGFWLLIQLMNAGRAGQAGVAWFAHLGGFLAGLVLVALLRRRRVPHSLY